MKSRLEKLLKIALSASIALPVLMTGTQTYADEIEIESDASLLLDYETGQILHEEDADEAKGIASMTKMLVEYILFEEIDAGNLNWDSEVIISDYAHR
ncbi:MAG: hypothetical protein L0J65_01685, partial [Alkalibacterium sp.]|nr:hypothetical protein [Alkalibacterium sp.]